MTSNSQPGPWRTTSERVRHDWVRFVLPDLIARLSWQSSGEVVTQLVSMLDLSMEQVTVLMDGDPPDDRNVTLFLDLTADGRIGPLPARLIFEEHIACGRTFAGFRFATPLPWDRLISMNQDLRAWRRIIPHEKRALLTWESHGKEHGTRGEMLDISGGGAAVRAHILPPTAFPVWLSLGAVGQESGAVECRLEGSVPRANGIHVVHLHFVELCPLETFKAAMGLIRPAAQGALP